ncbi:hypothetical protein [Uliginosibacterium gangwonense]|uniref:hypothetical protein n=1 Tax=Uliginosibacterium gangwonense TaxID=392736 RepID=UPI000370E19D|nr:hypothetical protein [Uliginosibacterium gangwonense]
MNRFRNCFLALVTISSMTTINMAFGDDHVCKSGFRNINDGDKGTYFLESFVAEAFLSGGKGPTRRHSGYAVVEDPDYQWLNDTIHQLMLPDCYLKDGQAYQNVILRGLAKGITDENNWNRAREKVEELRRKRPNEAYPIVAETEYWYKYAWDARGGGYASSVSPEGWKLFEERLSVAEKILRENKELGSSMPAWYELMVQVQSAMNHKTDERNKNFLEGAERYKTYLPLYISMRNYAEPRWGGSWAGVDQLIKFAANNTKKTEGDTFYAYLYYGVHLNMRDEGNFFKETKVNWPRLKSAYEELLQRRPESLWHLNNFAALACEAGDKKTFLHLRKKIGNTPFDESWGTRPSLDFCDAKYGYNN